jgi:hypothetical protein
MKIKINSLEFDVKPVPAVLATAVMMDPPLAPALRRDVYRWDAATQTGTPLVQMVADKGVPLANAISFFVPRLKVDGSTAKAEGPSVKMAERVLKATGAKSLTELMGALNRIIQVPQRAIPLDQFTALNPSTSYVVRALTAYSILELSHAARNLAGFLMVPSQVAFTCTVTDIADQAAHDALIAAKPDLIRISPAYIVPPRSKANIGLRAMAVAQSLTELQAIIDAAGGAATATDIQKVRGGALAAEWRMLKAADAQSQAQQQPQAPSVRA